MASRGNPTWLRYGSYFLLCFGIVWSVLTFRLTRQEYIAQHWPVATGEVLGAEIKSRLGGPQQDIYWVKFTVLFDVSPEECRPREPWIYKGSGRTRCWATFNTLEGSHASAYQAVKKHPKKSHSQFHYEPHGMGVRFAGEPAGSVYPWGKIAGALGIFGFAFVLKQHGRRLADLQDASGGADAREIG